MRQEVGYGKLNAPRLSLQEVKLGTRRNYDFPSVWTRLWTRSNIRTVVETSSCWKKDINTTGINSYKYWIKKQDRANVQSATENLRKNRIRRERESWTRQSEIWSMWINIHQTETLSVFTTEGLKIKQTIHTCGQFRLTEWPFFPALWEETLHHRAASVSKEIAKTTRGRLTTWINWMSRSRTWSSLWESLGCAGEEPDSPTSIQDRNKWFDVADQNDATVNVCCNQI